MTCILVGGVIDPEFTCFLSWHIVKILCSSTIGGPIANQTGRFQHIVGVVLFSHIYIYMFFFFFWGGARLYEKQVQKMPGRLWEC